MKSATAFLLPIALLTSSCSSSMNAPDIKKSPHPKMRYEVTLTIQDAPGPFDAITGNQVYEIANEQCTPFDKFIGIHHKPPSQFVRFDLSRTADNTYQGVVHFDLLEDEDYYGLGACHWSMTAAGMTLRKGDVPFGAYLTPDQIVSQNAVTLYFPKRAFTDPINGVGEIGMPALTGDDAIHRNDFFSVTISAKERFE